ncbi:anthranilate synthase component II [Echinicola vietnamensis]|uniref:Glutamine amidotransferase of anthranilate synthase or aminodeoxychorismate synthase n=1 Tax=Echinicola vietnamensis (strain DSM 17526 / LMG 23754 / KMM 6221) TaxID=926556 RepID=L0FW02_ECHVK|nr:aminodeoxychorismate/anthranilate synthase component II [Echinicola vietnamensis]AGA76936.1 glutamine amidotransferase of anthranilate synthase or aminodeoxychorismate synthase [Echinicola vietnamensis DSM 17526]
MLLLIDNFDSFSHILADYFRQAGFDLHIVRNDTPLAVLMEGKYEGLVLSPGPETPAKAGNLQEIFEYFHDKLPVLGVCLGHQCIGTFFGAKLVTGARPVHGKVYSVTKRLDHPMLNGLPERFLVTRYHSLELKDLPDCLQPLLYTEQGALMAMVHQTLPIVGIQYHPEAYLSEYGLQVIQNWGKCYVRDGQSRNEG